MTFAQPFAEYEILDRVGAGAMGTVFKARHKRLNRMVALKVLKPSLARDKRYVDRLRREARIVASLSHPNIVTGFDLGEEGGYHFFVMEFVEGKSLRGLLSEWGTFAEDYVRRVARQVAQALDHAYQRGVIHRDIKPGNILIDEVGNVKLTDMGLAKGPADLTLTRDGATVGTPQYISPEQARNPHDVDVRTDLYSLGATLYHMVTGVPPFRGDTMAELITNVLHELPVSPKAINSALTEGMSLVIRKLLAKDLTVRYQTPRDLLDDLDRLERSLPPQIDPDRLSEEEGQRARWWPRVLLAVGLLALVGGAWLLGVEMRERDGAPAPTADEFVAALDTRLAELPTPGARLVHLRTLPPPPSGAEGELLQRQRSVDEQLDRAVENVAASFDGEGWTRLATWMRDPAVWPDVQRVLRERVDPPLLERVGIVLGKLQPSRLGRLEQLQQTIDRTLLERDQGLLVRFEMHVKSKLPAVAREKLAADDFVAAERVWTEALVGFLDGVRMPLPERVAESQLVLLRDRLRAAQQPELQLIESQEGSLAATMRAEVDTACASLSQRLAGELSPQEVEAQLQQVRERLAQVYPPWSRFRPGRNPWPDLERRMSEVKRDVQAAIARGNEQRFEGRCDFAWRTFCHGRAEDALALLAAIVAANPTQAQRLDRHRAALTAARAVEQALLAAIARSTPPIVGFPRGPGTQTVELRAEQRGDAWVLTGATVQQEPRPVHLTELHFGKLLARLQQEREPLAALPVAERSLGVAVCRLVGDELAGLRELLAGLAPDDMDFLLDDVAPRVLRVRNEQADSPLDRQTLLTRMREARDAAGKGGPLADLEIALDQVHHGVAAAERSPEEDEEVRHATAWLRTARRGEQLKKDLQRAVPRDAEVDVRAAGSELVARVTLPATALHGYARDWQLRGRALEFAGAGRPWSELDQQMLEGSAGIEPAAMRTTLSIDLTFPPTAVGRRFYVVEFRGIACVVVLGADDSVHAALVDGDVRREDAVHAAFAVALWGVTAPARAVVVPGAVHQLSLDLVVSPLRTSAMVHVLFDGVELLPQQERRPLDPQRPVTFALHPQQEIAVTRVTVSAEGI